MCEHIIHMCGAKQPFGDYLDPASKQTQVQTAKDYVTSKCDSGYLG